MFWESFKITGSAVAQIFFLGAIGYFLVKKNILGEEGLDSLSRLVVTIIFPILVFCQLIKKFSFSLYPDWWIFPLISIAVTIAGLAVGSLFMGLIHGRQHKLQFLNLITFQNSGYLPLGLIAALLPKDKADTMLVYLFLFLLGFNLLVWSFGAYLLTFSRTKRFELASLFSPPVIAILVSLIFILFGLEKFTAEIVLEPLQLVGNCTLPLAMFILGGNLAAIRLGQVDKRAIFAMVLAKLIILPALGLWLILKFKLPGLLGLLILIQLAMPPATSLSLIVRYYKKEDLLISQGIFFGHIISLVTIPIFLSLYFTLGMVR